MEVEKKRSKGGFFGLFDWHSKSKKKLFAHGSESSGQSNREREIEESSVKSRRHLVTEVDGFGSSLVYKGSSDFSSSSSVTSDEGCGNKAPGVVARLMGLESLPTLNVAEPYSTPLCESRSLRASQYERSTPNLWNDYHPTDYLMIPNKDGPSWNHVEPRVHKVLNRPLDRFQTEVLPPKSAKPISITHHKLLSPIKSPGFIPTNNAAYIMEAAAKIIEPSPAGSRKNRVPSIGTPSVPLRIRDLKEKMEAVHRASRVQTTKESIANKGKPNDRNRGGSAYTPALETLPDSEKKSPERSKVKGKSVSLAVQAKVNVQRRDRATSSNINSSMNQERTRVKQNHNIKSEPNVPKTEHKRTSANRNSSVLRQNSQKQNSVSNKDKIFSKTSVSVHQPQKSHSINGSAGTNKTVKKVAIKSDLGSRTKSSMSNDSHLQPSSSKQKNTSRKKRTVAGDLHSGESVADNVLTNKVEKSVKLDSCAGASSWTKLISNGKSNGLDIVSFTFTSPIKGTTSECHFSSQVTKEAASRSLSMDSSADNGQSLFKESELSSGSNMISGDALSILLEQKLKELVDKVDLSNSNVVNTENSANSVSSACSTTTEMSYAVNSSLREHIDIEGSQLDLPVDTSYCLDNESSLTSQDLGEVDAYSTGSTNAEPEKDINCWLSSPISDQLFSAAVGDCSTNRGITEVNKWRSLTQVHEDCKCLSENDQRIVECETEVSDSASSLSSGSVLRDHTSRITDTKRSCNWELEYVRNIINSSELMFEDFKTGRSQNVISPDLFYQLENQEGGTQRYGGECYKVTRKVLFDCVSGCLDTRCGQSFSGSCKAWDIWSTLHKKKGLLAEELYREILSWQSMEDLMVDELLDKDMSTQRGRWLDFNLEAFEEGVEIEKEIIERLVNELVKDLYL